ncbi:MAG: M81 family metallopeptidase [Anaerolineae bacterium]|nr:M81 family metallopeptidase [Anaerolineae bacterium]
MRIALGAYTHEANCFCAHATDLADFQRRQLDYGPKMLAHWEARRSEISGGMSVLSRHPECEVVPLLAARALAAAPIREGVFRALLNDLCARLRAAMPVDGVLLVLHGAMMAEETPDATGELLAQVRAIVGEKTPIAGTLDLHANVTEQMARSATALIGYHTTPHIDQYETGETAASLLLSAVTGESSPTMALVRLPWISSSENCTDQWGPLAEVLQMVHKLEQSGAILHAGIYPVQAWLDTPDVASAVVVITDGDLSAAERHAQELAQAFWARRARFIPQRIPPDEAIQRALARPTGTVIFCDSADSTPSGATGDSTTILEAMLRAVPLGQVALLNIVDREVVAQAIEAGVGSRITARVGGKVGTAFYRPVPFEGYVKLISDGDFHPRSGGSRGSTQHRGRAVVLIHDGIHLAVSEEPASQWHPEFYRSLGEEPADARIIQIKSPMGYRAAYEGLFDEVMLIDAPGASTPDLASLPWRRVARPIYPLDEETRWP